MTRGSRFYSEGLKKSEGITKLISQVPNSIKESWKLCSGFPHGRSDRRDALLLRTLPVLLARSFTQLQETEPRAVRELHKIEQDSTTLRWMLRIRSGSWQSDRPTGLHSAIGGGVECTFHMITYVAPAMLHIIAMGWLLGRLVSSFLGWSRKRTLWESRAKFAQSISSINWFLMHFLSCIVFSCNSTGRECCAH